MQRSVLFLAILCWNGIRRRCRPSCRKRNTVLAFSNYYCPSGYVFVHEPRSPLRVTNSVDVVESSDPSNSGEMQQNERRWILLVDYDRAFRNNIGEYLADEGGYFVTGVPDARSAILVCRGAIRNKNKVPVFSGVGKSKQALNRPDCLVLDLNISGSMNGMDLLKIVRSDPNIASLPVVLLAERGRAEDRLKGYDAGADAYLSKPFDRDELLALVDGLVRKDRSLSTRARRSDGSHVLASAVMKSEELRREILEIKHLLRDLGFQMNVTLKNAQYDDLNGGSIEQSLMEIKDSIGSGIVQSHSSVIEHDKDSNAETTPLEANHVILLPDEVAIINLIDQGMTNKEIASRTKLPLGLVTKTLNGMFQRVNVKNKTELLQWWKNYRHNFGP